MQRHRRRGAKQLAVDRRQHADMVIRPRRRSHNARVRVDHFQELADDQRNRLDALDLLLGAEELALEGALLLADVLLLGFRVFFLGGESRSRLRGRVSRASSLDALLLSLSILSLSLSFLSSCIHLSLPGSRRTRAGAAGSSGACRGRPRSRRRRPRQRDASSSRPKRCRRCPWRRAWTPAGEEGARPPFLD